MTCVSTVQGKRLRFSPETVCLPTWCRGSACRLFNGGEKEPRARLANGRG